MCTLHRPINYFFFFLRKTLKYVVIATVHDFSAWVNNSGTNFLVRQIAHMPASQWEHGTMRTVNSNCPQLGESFLPPSVWSIHLKDGRGVLVHQNSHYTISKEYNYKRFMDKMDRGQWTNLARMSAFPYTNKIYFLIYERSMKLFNEYWKYTE